MSGLGISSDVERWITELVRREVESAVAAAIEDAIDSIAIAAPVHAPVLVDRGDPWVTIARAARMAGVKVTTVRRWIDDGRLTRQGTPRRVLVRRDELERLLTGGANANGRVP